MGTDHRALMWAEVADIGTLLHELDDAELDGPSLCTGWAVRDVVGHVAFGHTAPWRVMVPQMVRYRFDIPRASFEQSKRFAAERTADELRAFWDEHLVRGHARKGIAKVIKDREGFLDHLIHQQDMRRPTGRVRDIPEERLMAALELLPVVHTRIFSTKKQAEALRLVSTDVSWSHGDGPTVEGPAEALIMAVAGRPAALADLEGDGVSVLAARTGAPAPS